jgi:hypothetical protein
MALAHFTVSVKCKYYCRIQYGARMEIKKYKQTEICINDIIFKAFEVLLN